MQQSCENSRCIGSGSWFIYIPLCRHPAPPSWYTTRSCQKGRISNPLLGIGVAMTIFLSCYASEQDIVVGLHIHGPTDRYHAHIDTPCGYKLHVVVRFMTQLLPDLCTRRFHWLTQHCVSTCCQSAAFIAICMNYTRGICYFCARTHIYIYIYVPFPVATFVGRSTTSRCLLGCRNSLRVSPIHLPVWTP